MQALRQAAMALQGGLAQADAFNYEFEPGEHDPVDEFGERFDTTIANGESLPSRSPPARARARR